MNTKEITTGEFKLDETAISTFKRLMIVVAVKSKKRNTPELIGKFIFESDGDIQTFDVKGNPTLSRYGYYLLNAYFDNKSQLQLGSFADEPGIMISANTGRRLIRILSGINTTTIVHYGEFNADILGLYS